MAQSLAAINVHIVFTTVDRRAYLTGELKANLYAYLAGIARKESSLVYEIGGVEDHVHMLCSLPKTIALAKLVEKLKSSSSKWLKTQDNDLKFFSWQSGYGAFSVSSSQMERTVQYIRNQAQHHQSHTFENEYRSLLKAYNINFDERFLWS